MRLKVSDAKSCYQAPGGQRKPVPKLSGKACKTFWHLDVKTISYECGDDKQGKSF
jgi:hypothetical protein